MQTPPPPPSLPWSARTVVASHESPPVVSVHGHRHCFLNVFTAPRQNVIDRSLYRSSGSSFTFHHPKHQWLQQSVVRHSADMAEQLELSLSDGVHHRPLPLHLSSDFIVGDVVLTVDFQYVCNNSSQMPAVYADHLSLWSTFLLHTTVPQRRTSVTAESSHCGVEIYDPHVSACDLTSVLWLCVCGLDYVQIRSLIVIIIIMRHLYCTYYKVT